MINFYYELNFILQDEKSTSDWASSLIKEEGFKEGEINYIFCDDDYLLKINQDYLNHDTYTDIISFDYSVGKELHGDIYISIPRVKENSIEFDQEFQHELHRVIAHGILHFCGFKDKSNEDKLVMRSKEDQYLALLG